MLPVQLMINFVLWLVCLLSFGTRFLSTSIQSLDPIMTTFMSLEILFSHTRLFDSKRYHHFRLQNSEFKGRKITRASTQLHCEKNYGGTEVAHSGKVRIQVSGLFFLAAACSLSRYLQLFIRVQSTPSPAFIPGTSCIGATNIMITSLLSLPPSSHPSIPSEAQREEGGRKTTDSLTGPKTLLQQLKVEVEAGLRRNREPLLQATISQQRLKLRVGVVSKSARTRLGGKI